MAQCDVHLTMDTDRSVDAAAADTPSTPMSEEPPKYTDRDYTNNSEEPPPPPYAVPLEHPPPYQTPPRNTASPFVRFTSEQPRQVNIGLLSYDLRNRVIYDQPSNTPWLKLLLACAVFWLCGFIFGAVAFILAKMSLRNSQSPRDQKMNLYMGRASIAISFFGIAFGAVVLTVVLSFARSVSASNCITTPTTSLILSNLTTSTPVSTTSVPQCALQVGDIICYKYSSSYSRLECDSLGGLVQPDSETHRFMCYHNKCDDYAIRTMCFKHRSALLPESECRRLNGLFDVIVSGSSCYYNRCPGYTARNNECYRTRKLSSRAGCIDGYYEDAFCYTT